MLFSWRGEAPTLPADPSLTNCTYYPKPRRIIEVLDLFSDEDAFDLAVSNLDFWADWVDEESVLNFSPEIFSKCELSVIRAVNASWEKVGPDSLKSSKEWLSLVVSSKHAISIFMERGWSDENDENA